MVRKFFLRCNLEMFATWKERMATSGLPSPIKISLFLFRLGDGDSTEVTICIWGYSVLMSLLSTSTSLPSIWARMICDFFLLIFISLSNALIVDSMSFSSKWSMLARIVESLVISRHVVVQSSDVEICGGVEPTSWCRWSCWRAGNWCSWNWVEWKVWYTLDLRVKGVGLPHQEVKQSWYIVCSKRVMPLASRTTFSLIDSKPPHISTCAPDISTYWLHIFPHSPHLNISPHVDSTTPHISTFVFHASTYWI